MTGNSYRKAGVDVDKGNKIAENIKELTSSEASGHVISGVGGFGALFQPKGEYNDPVYIAATDGVGTKLKLARLANKFDTIGIDLVAMCVNDVLAQGGQPLIFLDYLAMDSLEEDLIQDIIQGIVAGCHQSDCSLVGGETAEMPGFYQNGLFDLAGFCVGVVEKDNIVDGSSIKETDQVIGISSSGVHSNGLSLVRKTLIKEEGGQYELDETPSNLETNLGEELLKPTKIYVKPVLSLMEKFSVAGMAHITGGGLPDNLSRIVPDNLSFSLDLQKLQKMVLPVFSLIQTTGDIPDHDMWRTFNMGIGFTVVLPAEEAQQACEFLREQGEKAEIIGTVEQLSQQQGDGVQSGERVMFVNGDK
ncbi:phosphoribosylformylglycinamidine cyclo-ligase [Natranaerobius thermophilus]|uniref:Phosphoribosylformylglycinamidine cyclo-ligase n=1 Tax=Natranaerobius thermophilus (strain ATCC BAA-1301 / DSM 18059 / JW/NM-WN-LF) TaxID=457570 RepID=B2A5V9_NATTJ|nr:phosphoribosylformylglycinamidine cyclo-ligase [Natranaerobius thermophilus]ACB84052.1 phosphoribosylformylglycinamidine cyclo-ligase [Natranaerobius thermophilus JW/NM-WN-LF]